MRFLPCLAAVLCAATTTAQAATVSTSGFDIDTVLFADDVSVVTGNARTAPFVIGADLETSTGIGLGDVVEVIFHRQHGCERHGH